MTQMSIELIACINIYVFKGENSFSRWIDGTPTSEEPGTWTAVAMSDPAGL